MKNGDIKRESKASANKNSQALNLSYPGERRNDVVLKNKFSYNKDGKVIKSVFLPPKHIFPDNTDIIKSSQFSIQISPYYQSVVFYDEYIDKVAPTLDASTCNKSIRSINPRPYSLNNTDIIRDRANGDRIEEEQYSYQFDPENFSTTISPNDFEIKEVVGTGYFGKVTKVVYKQDKMIYAMKSCKKSKLKENKQIEHSLNERKILGSIIHPFIVNLKFSFQTQTKLYLIMEYLSGGELFYHMKKTKYFEEKIAIFYVAQIVCALDFLHENKIIYRDLKPENLVLDGNGYLKLTDFGLSKENIGENQTTSTFCGTPEYLSPEMIKGDPYSQSVDMWSLGIIFFEMLTGVPPFFDKNKDKLYKKIYFNDPNFAINKKVFLSDLTINFISKLLCKNPYERMTIREAKRHKLFENFNFEKLMAYELEPPIKINQKVSFF